MIWHFQSLGYRIYAPNPQPDQVQAQRFFDPAVKPNPRCAATAALTPWRELRRV
jgi:hypothetical protein